ncbi:hypothetical protein D3C73_1281990 [compost metagenome]
MQFFTLRIDRFGEFPGERRIGHNFFDFLLIFRCRNCIFNRDPDLFRSLERHHFHAQPADAAAFGTGAGGQSFLDRLFPLIAFQYIDNHRLHFLVSHLAGRTALFPSAGC